MMMMSDGALSQAEIDALLAGVDSSSLGGSAPAATAVASNFPEESRKALEAFFNSTVNAQSSNLSKMTGASISLSGPQLSIDGRDGFLAQLSDTVTVVKVDFNAGFPGEHLFIFTEEGAKAVAALMTKEENIQLDEMALSVIGEVISTMVGHQITALSDKTGNKSIASIPPEASNIPKAVVAMPTGDFAGLTYQLDLGTGVKFHMWEVLGASVTSDIAKALISGPKQQSPSAAPSAGAHQNAMPGNYGGMAMNPMNMGGMQGMGMPGMGGMPMGGMGMPMGGMGMPMGGIPYSPTNVQSVQFPNLMPHSGPQEAGNIGLIMDVSMEMTVELGRTKKLIKEILAMGEGTIIELDKLAGEPVDILVNHKLIAKGEVVVIDENFGVRVTEIVSPMERMNNMD